MPTKYQRMDFETNIEISTINKRQTTKPSPFN